MNFSQFEIEITDILSERLKGECEVLPTDVRKNNDTFLRGLRFVRRDRILQPTIYLDNYYRVCEEGRDIRLIADVIIADYRGAAIEDTPDLSFLNDYSAMKDRIVCKLINASKNKALLKEVPHVLFLDLAAVFYCRIELPGSGEGSTLIHNYSFEQWGISVGEMYRDALKNNERLLGGKATPIATVLQEIWAKLKGADSQAPCDFPEEAFKVPMFVLTNRLGLNGAACMLNNSLLKEFSDDHGGDFFIIPSSVHELILLPADRKETASEIKEIVKTINRTELPKADILSDEVYFYNREKNAVVMA